MPLLPTYLQLGIEHILDLDAYDHMLFLLVLIAPFGWKDWKAILGLITSFTIGHAATIVLTTYGTIPVPSSVVELSIAITILVSAINHYFHASGTVNLSVYVVALIFGCIHGMGFASYLSSILGEDLLMPLIGFNLGVELGQIIFVLFVLAGLFIGMRFLHLKHAWWRKSVCIIGFVLSLIMIIERI